MGGMSGVGMCVVDVSDAGGGVVVVGEFIGWGRVRGMVRVVGMVRVIGTLVVSRVLLGLRVPGGRGRAGSRAVRPGVARCVA